MGKRLTVLATVLLLVWSMTAAAFAKEPEISVKIDQTGQDSAAAVVTLGSEVYTSILVKVPGEPWYDFTWVLEDAKSMTLPVYENGTVQVQATRENGTKATASATVDCLPEPEPMDCPVESEPEPEKEPEQQPMSEKLDRMKDQKEKAEQKLRYYQHQEKMLEHRIPELTRKARTHRLCTRGGMLEGFLICPGELTDDQVMELLKLSFRQQEVALALAKMIHDLQEARNVPDPSG